MMSEDSLNAEINNIKSSLEEIKLSLHGFLKNQSDFEKNLAVLQSQHNERCNVSTEALAQMSTLRNDFNSYKEFSKDYFMPKKALSNWSDSFIKFVNVLKSIGVVVIGCGIIYIIVKGLVK
jgi:sulfur relay (sulfurtransferase) DsrC/TusE family protein